MHFAFADPFENLFEHPKYITSKLDGEQEMKKQVKLLQSPFLYYIPHDDDNVCGSWHCITDNNDEHYD